MTKHILPIVSGGLDSCVMLYHLHSENYQITEVITFNYGQKHSKETEYAKSIVDYFNKSLDENLILKVVDIQNIGELISKGALTGSDALPAEMYDSDNQRVTVVPNRNMIFLSIAAGRAITIGASSIGYAAHASDYSVYPDCRPEFIEAMDRALVEGNLWDPINLVAPFKYKTKAEIVKLGSDLDAPLNLTWSCYEGGDRPCMRCGTCLERTEAFMSNNLKDPALNEPEWDKAVITYNEIKNNQQA